MLHRFTGGSVLIDALVAPKSIAVAWRQRRRRAQQCCNGLLLSITPSTVQKERAEHEASGVKTLAITALELELAVPSA